MHVLYFRIYVISGTVIATVVATDDDRTSPNNQVTYTLSGTSQFVLPVKVSHIFYSARCLVTRRLTRTNTEGKAHAGNATQNIHPPFMQKTRIHIQPHTLHHSCIY